MTSATVAKTAAKTTQSQAKPEKIRRDHKVNWWLTAVVAVLSLTVLVPLYFAVVTALKTPSEAGTFSLPTTWEWHNFADAWNKVNYPKAALNSAIITVCAVVLTLLTNTFVAYAVARNMDKRFFRFLYYFFLAMMFVPFTVIMLPIAKEMGSLHLDNQLGLIILYTILGIGTNLFIAIGFIRSIPISLEEAARIDGASTWRITPYPVGHWKISDDNPKDGEKYISTELDTLGKGTENQGWSNEGEHALEHCKGELRNACRHDGIQADAVKETFIETTDDASQRIARIGIFCRECPRIPEGYPYQTDYCHDENRLHQDAEDILLAHQTTIKKCYTRD